MRITDLLQTESIALNSHPAQKEEAIEQAVALMAASGHLSDVSAFREAVFIREEQGTTGVGDGNAIPHGKTQAVSTPGLSAMVIPDGDVYKRQSLVGKTVIIVANLKPTKIRGIVSEGMILSAADDADENLSVSTVLEDAHLPAGARVR